MRTNGVKRPKGNIYLLVKKRNAFNLPFKYLQYFGFYAPLIDQTPKNSKTRICLYSRLDMDAQIHQRIKAISDYIDMAILTSCDSIFQFVKSSLPTSTGIAITVDANISSYILNADIIPQPFSFAGCQVKVVKNS